MAPKRIAGGTRLESRARYLRTWQNVGTNGGDGMLRNTPDGFPGSGYGSSLAWQGSDTLSQILQTSPSGFTQRTVGGITYTIPTGGAGNPTSLPAVGRATSLVCDTIADLPWRVLRDHEPLPTPGWIADPQLARPDDRIMSGQLIAPMTNVTFWSEVLRSALWKGIAIVWIPSRTSSGAPKAPLFVLNPDAIVIRQTPSDGLPAGYYIADGGASDVQIPTDEILIVQGEGPYIDGAGQGVLTRYADTLNTGQIMSAYMRDVFGSGVPAGFLKTTSPNLSEPQAQELKAAWMKAHGRSGTDVAVLNAATTFQPIAFSPVDAALIDSGVFNSQNIALAFGMSPYMLGLPSGSETYANIVDRHTELVTFTLTPWARRLEAALGTELPLGTDLRVDFRALLRGDTPTRYATYEVGLRNGFLTVDEVRQLEDLGELGPLPIADLPPEVSP